MCLLSIVSLYAGPQPPKWRASSRAEHSSMSSLVSTVIRQDREDKAIAAVLHPKGSGEGQMKASHQLQDESMHIGNGRNGVSLDTDVNQPASPSHQVSRLCVGGGRGEEKGDWMRGTCC